MRKGRPVSWMALSGCCSVIPSVEKRYRPVPAAAQRVWNYTAQSAGVE